MANNKSQNAKGNNGNGNGKSPKKSETPLEPNEPTANEGSLLIGNGNGNGQSASNRVAQTNNAAKDDSFTSQDAEWLAESSGLTGSLDVLANDPGSARIIAVHGEMPAVAGPVVPNDGGTFTVVQDGNEYEVTLAINDDGTIAVDASSLGGLTEGESAQVSFYYTAQMGKNGAMSTAKVTVEVTGADSPAEISGDVEGAVEEDGVLAADGSLTVEDADAGEAGFEEVTDAAALAGAFGDFTFNAETGGWTYTLRNADENVQALNTGDSETDTLTVMSIDGTEQDIVISIAGADEAGGEPVQPENAGFEDGLTGFLTIGSVNAVTTSNIGGSTVAPTQGTQLASLSNEPGIGETVATAEELETFLGLTVGTLTGLGNGNAVEGSALQTTLTLGVGETLSFDYRFDTQDQTFANDFAFVSLTGEDTAELADVEAVGDFGDTDWQTYSYTATSAGEYALGVGVVDSGDFFNLSALYVDNLVIG